VTRTTVLFIIAAISPMIFLLVELSAAGPDFANWISYSILVIALIALIAALYETFRGYAKNDAEDLMQ
jgi:hypothetical protein